jgi:ribonuclease E
MKAIMSDLEIPAGMAVIMRTAGVGRSRAEIKRDYEYLRRLWDEIRDLTLQSSAPALIYEEGDVIKRSLRDTYNRDIDEVLIEGEEAYKSAKALMKTMIPSHAKRVQKYAETDIPLFNRYQIEAQLDEIYEPVVTLKSGGYLVINPTEALVAIDVNSGRATRQRNVEGTARQTNLEAAEEIARQLRLRDLAGLIVIDFIDMDENRNNAAVERKIKEAMKTDRARIQIGRISPFGLLELSRQRLRPSLTEASSQVCSMCGGSGHIRSTESTALRILRAIEDEGIRRRSSEIQVNAPTIVALYLLNQKRHALNAIEARYEFRVFINGDADLVPPDFQIERTQDSDGAGRQEPRQESRQDARPDRAPDDRQQSRPDSRQDSRPPAEEDERGGRRRRRGRRRRDEDTVESVETISSDETDTDIEDEDDDAVTTDAIREPGTRDEGSEDAHGARRRRGRRGGRRRRRGEEGAATTAEPQQAGDDAVASDEQTVTSVDTDTLPADADETAAPDTGADAQEDRPRRRRRPRRHSATADNEGATDTPSADADAGTQDAGDAAADAAPTDAGTPSEGAADAAPKRRRRPRRSRAAAEAASDDSEGLTTGADATEADVASSAPETNDTAAVPPVGVAAETAANDDNVAPADANGHDVKADAATDEPEDAPVVTPEPESQAATAKPAVERPQRRGWWNRMIG